MDQRRSRKQRSNLYGTPLDSYLYDEPGLDILAYLERTLMYSLPSECFAPSVILYCREQLLKDMSESAIQAKLKLFWSHWHPVGDKPSNWKKIYHLGLKGLPRLEEEKAEWVRKRAIELQDTEGTPRRLRSASAIPSVLRSIAKRPPGSLVGDLSSSQARKRRKHDESPTQRKARSGRSASVYTRRTRLKQSMTTHSPLTRYSSVTFELPDSQEVASSIDVSFQTPISPASERESSTSSLRESSQQHFDDLTNLKKELVPSNHSSPSELLGRSADQGRCSQVMSELDNARDQGAQIMSKLDDVRSQNAQLKLELEDVKNEKAQLKLELNDVKNEKAQLKLELNDVTNQKAQLMSELDDLRIQKVDDTRHWKGLYRETRKQQNSLKDRNRHMQAELVGLGQDDVSNTNLKLRCENDLLKEKLDGYQATFQFKEPFMENFRAQNVQKVVEHVEVLLSKLHKVLQGQDALVSIEKLDSVKRSDLTKLFKRGFGPEISIDDSAGNTIPTKELCRTQLRAVVLTLVSAALCTWVFEAEVGVLFQENDLAYSKLQSLLAAQDQELTDRIEFAAHKECIEDPFISNLVIPRRARYLAQRVLNCITPLLEEHRSLNEQYADMADEWTEADQQLIEIFKQALYAKVRLLLTTDLYRCAFHVPGTSFDDGTMEKRNEGVVHGTENESDAVVDITIFPGLLRYASKKKCFSYNRFLRGQKAAKEIRAKVLRKAVVLTR